MDKIDVCVLNPDATAETLSMLALTARITQRAEKIVTMDDLHELYMKPVSAELVKTLVKLPHPTLQKFGVFNIAIVGASRRFLAQITRHQNEVKFMSGSLQYSDYSDAASFTVPYEMIKADAERMGNAAYLPLGTKWHVEQYQRDCTQMLKEYEAAIKAGVPKDAAGYLMPQGMRNVLIISATLYQWKHMIRQRTCNRNTLETQYVMLRCWEELVGSCLSSAEAAMFTDWGPPCIAGEGCPEGKMSCGRVDMYYTTPTEFLDEEFQYIREEAL